MSEEKNKEIKIEARAYPLNEPKGNVMAFASITINDVFAVKGIRVMNSEKGLFAAMPSTKDNKGEYKEICFPVTKDMRILLNNAVVGAYEAAMLEKGKEEKDSVSDKIKSTDKTPAKPKEKAEKKKPER